MSCIMGTGRSSEYTPEKATFICLRIASGESLRKITADPDMPCQATVFNWLSREKSFLEQYMRAREAQMEVMAQEIIDIADDSSRDTIVTEDGSKPDAEWINRSRLRVDTRKWLMSKLAPKKYGDKITHAGDSDQPLEVVVRRIGPKE